MSVTYLSTHRRRLCVESRGVRRADPAHMESGLYTRSPDVTLGTGLTNVDATYAASCRGHNMQKPWVTLGATVPALPVCLATKPLLKRGWPSFPWAVLTGGGVPWQRPKAFWSLEGPSFPYWASAPWDTFDHLG